MKILFIAHDLGFGGATSSLINIIENINKSYPNYKIYVLIRKGNLKYENLLSKLDCVVIRKSYFLLGGWPSNRSKKNVLIHKIKWHLQERVINDLTAREMATFVKKEKIDIIHSNSSIIDIGCLIAKYSGVAHVWHFREFLQEDQNTIMWCSKSYFNQIVYKYTKKIIAVSRAVKSKYEKLYGNKIQVIYNGVPELSNCEDIKRKKDNTINIVQVGKVCIGKGHDITIKAIECLIKDGYNNIKLILIGNPVFDFDKSIYYKIQNYVEVIGQKDIEEVNRIRMEKGDIEVVSSRAEAFGRVTVEAMMCGLPVIGADSGGTPELIKNNINGLLYTQGDYHDLAQKIRRLIDDKKLRDSIGTRAKQEARYYSIDRCVNEILEIYNEIK